MKLFCVWIQDQRTTYGQGEGICDLDLLGCVTPILQSKVGFVCIGSMVCHPFPAPKDEAEVIQIHIPASK